MNKTTFILISLCLLGVSVASAGTMLSWLGNVDRTYDNGITCYFGQIYPGQSIYFCMNQDGSMNHSFFPNQTERMDNYYLNGTGWQP